MPKGNHDSNTRGFAAMDEQKQRSIARKGGEAVSRDREHMSEIGKMGGVAVSRNREHMAAIGRKGGEASGGSGRNSSQRNSEGTRQNTNR